MPEDTSILLLLVILICPPYQDLEGQGLRNQRMDGYRGIWFELGQKYPFGDKYAGGLGTYTAKHRPMAVYSSEVEKTFFVYGGTTNREERHLLCMTGAFDHRNGSVSRPVVAWDKMGVDDPHDNPSICIDHKGYIHIYVSGRGNRRPGIKLKSYEPFSIDSFRVISVAEFTYPQVWKAGEGLFHFFTRYTGTRELYFQKSSDGKEWSSIKKLAGIRSPGDSLSGHYQLSDVYEDGRLIGTFFNRHKNGHPDTRTGLYYICTTDQGETWTDAEGRQLAIPVVDTGSSAKVLDFEMQGLHVYLKDMDYDSNGNPICLVLTSQGHEPGPGNAPYTLRLVRRNPHTSGWEQIPVCESDHNYDMGSLYLTDSLWYVVAPVADPPQAWGVGGEVVLYGSRDEGGQWELLKQITRSSELNHSYIRRPENFSPPFCFFWASGHPHRQSISELYFGDFRGRVWKLPYTMGSENAFPQRVNTENP
jgi:hypothetical protein